MNAVESIQIASHILALIWILAWVSLMLLSIIKDWHKASIWSKIFFTGIYVACAAYLIGLNIYNLTLHYRGTAEITTLMIAMPPFVLHALIAAVMILLLQKEIVKWIEERRNRRLKTLLSSSWSYSYLSPSSDALKK